MPALCLILQYDSTLPNPLERVDYALSHMNHALTRLIDEHEMLNFITQLLQKVTHKKHQVIQFPWKQRTYQFIVNTIPLNSPIELLVFEGRLLQDMQHPPTSLQFLNSLANNLPDMLWAKDLSGGYLFTNQALCDGLLMAKDTQEPLGKNDLFFAQREREKHPNRPDWHTFGELCLNTDDVTLEYMKPMRFVESGNIKGTPCHLEVHKAPFYNCEGELIGTVGSGRDITEEVNLRNALKATDETLKILLDATLDALIIYDAQYSCIHTNQNASKLTGYSIADILSRKVIDFIFPEDLPLIIENTNNLQKDVYPIKVKHQSGRAIDCMVRTQEMIWKDQPVHVAAIIDISEMTKSRKQLEDAQHIAHMGSCEINLITHQMHLSPEAYLIYGYQPNEIEFSIETAMSHVHPDDIDAFRTCFEQGVLQGKPSFSEHRIIDKHNTLHHVQHKSKPHKNKAGETIAVFATLIDVTKQVEAQQEILRQKDELAYRAHYDSLTNLPNRTLFIDRLSQAIDHAKQRNTKFAMLFIDLDRFKEINDTLGHSIGDEMLQQVALRLQSALGTKDTVSRLGGDEFTIILEESDTVEAVNQAIKKLGQSLSETIQLGQHNFHATMSIGAAFYPDDGQDTETLLKHADAAMYQAKGSGRNTHRFYNKAMTDSAVERLAMEVSLREALENNEFSVYYQPKIDAETNLLTGSEALIRWRHPVLGLVTPINFMSIAEETGLIIAIDRWMMREAMLQFKRWLSLGLTPGTLSLNLAIQQIYHKDFISFITDLMSEIDLKAQWIELEISEGQIMKDPENAISILKRIQSLGITLAVDDFGTGYSSLSYLKKLPIDTLKIDQSFIRNVANDEEDQAISKAIIALGTSLNLTVVAEGVETEAQRQFVIENGCHIIQGYYFSRPLNSEDMTLYMKHKSSD
ncbi:MAG: EAL domain-containing protein [Gammaproteobacteria bacterium]|nr:EAL domain-containing protein [Gammaproteobacteria bacterium]